MHWNVRLQHVSRVVGGDEARLPARRPSWSLHVSFCYFHELVGNIQLALGGGNSRSRPIEHARDDVAAMVCCDGCRRLQGRVYTDNGVLWSYDECIHVWNVSSCDDGGFENLEAR